MLKNTGSDRIDLCNAYIYFSGSPTRHVFAKVDPCFLLTHDFPNCHAFCVSKQCFQSVGGFFLLLTFFCLWKSCIFPAGIPLFAAL